MDLLAYLASIERRADAVMANAAALKDEVDQVRRLHIHQVEQWSERVRTPLDSVLPSQLPDRTLGPALREVRDYLRHAPGAPVDPEFDRVVGGLGVAAARLVAERHAHRGTDVAWIELARSLADRPGAAADRME